MENTLENKTKFFSQYWGQEVLIANPHVNNRARFKCVYPWINHNTDIAWLELKPLSSITDEDAKFCSETLGFDISDYEDGEEILKEQIIEIHHEDIGFADCLRSKGYVLPWMGLSVEKLVEYGWIKLKED